VEGESRTLEILERPRDGWIEILPSAELRDTAMRLLRVHPLRGGNALQLAAARVWAGSWRGASLVTLDERLALVARLEGFQVFPRQ
jgi:predicted nucleic acid-binding protein